MKKVLIVIPSLCQGGGQKFVMDLANGIDKTKFHVRVLVYFKESDTIFDRFARDNGIETVYLDKKYGFDPAFFSAVKKAVKEFKPDVIHTHLLSMLYLFTSYNRKQIKLHTVHTMADKENFGLYKKVNFLAFKVFGVTPVAISDTVADSISEIHKIKRENVPIVYNGVDCKRYDIPKVATDAITLVSLGSITYVKNHIFLLECFAEVIKEIKNLRLIIVGDGNLRSSIEKKIKDLGIEEYVEITGFVSDVENYLAKSDICVGTSRFEGLPLSFLEAMSAGLPVISTNVGGVKDIIKTGVNGILVEYADKEEYVKALKELILDDKKREEYSKNAKALSRNYDESITVAGYQKLYDK